MDPSSTADGRRPGLPADPTERPAFIARGPWFRTLAVTDADRMRSASYRAQGDRRRAQASAGPFEDYLASLEQRLTIELVTEATVPRAAQLCQRTNQFNLTTRRHTQADVERMLADPAYDLVTLSVTDRFGDSGITGLGITLHADGRAEPDTLLLSRRLLGRRIEDAFLAVLARRARERGARTLLGAYEPPTATPRSPPSSPIAGSPRSVSAGGSSTLRPACLSHRRS